MSASTQPSPDAGGTPETNAASGQQPQQSRSPGKLDAQQSADIKTVILRCVAAQKPEYAGPLATEGIECRPPHEPDLSLGPY